MKRKVLIIVENASVPCDPRVWHEATSLRRNGYEVSVLCPRTRNGEKRYEVLDGIYVYRHPMPAEANRGGHLREYLCAVVWEFLYTSWIFFTRGFNVIQGCNPPDSIFLVCLPFKLLGVKYIFDHHDVCPELYLAKFAKKDSLYRAQLYLERLTFRFSDVVMSTNNSYRDIALTRGQVSPEKVFVIRNGPDLATFNPVPRCLSLKYGKSYLVGYVGNMDTQDSLDLLLDVAFCIKQSGRRDVHFTCVGGGPALTRLRTMTKDRGLGDMVNFTGRIPDKNLLEILSTADVCINPDKPCEMNNISTMIKIMEYMALGKPIVQFDLKEGKVSAQKASLYAMNVKDFAEKVLWLLDNADVRKSMGEYGRERVESQLSWDHSVQHLLAAYQRALATPRWKARPVANFFGRLLSRD